MWTDTLSVHCHFYPKTLTESVFYFILFFFFFLTKFNILRLVLELFALLLSKGKQNRQAARHTSQTSCFRAVLANVTHNRNLVQGPHIKKKNKRKKKSEVNVVAEHNKLTAMHSCSSSSMVLTFCLDGFRFPLTALCSIKPEGYGVETSQLKWH